jgi:hypothetical protein
MKAITPALIVAATMLAMSGACSMHDPGPYEGGGRSTTQPLPQGTTPTDSSVPDTFVQDTAPPIDVFQGNQ